MANVSALVSVYLELSRQKSKRFVGEFAHASHTGIPCPARLTYRDSMPVPGMEQKVAL